MTDLKSLVHNREITPLLFLIMTDLNTVRQYSITLDALADGEIIYTVSNLSNVTLLAVSGYNWIDTCERLEWLMVEYGIFID
jgi:hypothetical protein